MGYQGTRSRDCAMTISFILVPLTSLLVFLRARRLKLTGIAPLTSLRAFAAVIVFALHFTEGYRNEHPGFLSGFIHSGFEGVNIFFVLSGFLLTLVMLRDLKMHEFDVRRYFVRRAARIYPLYYALLFIVYLIVPSRTRWQDWLLIQGFFPSAIFSGITTAWTLTVEECFYVLLPLVVWSCVKFRWPIALTVWSIGLLVIGIIVTGLNIPDVLGSPEYAWSISIFGRFPIFAVGIACAFLYQHRKQWPIALLVGSAAILFAVMCGTALEVSTPQYRLSDLLTALAVGGIVLGLASENRLTRFLGNRYFVYLGMISYALYLIQLTPLMAWVRDLVHSVPDLAMAYAIATLFSMAFYDLVERPARIFILKHFSQVGSKQRLLLPVK